jgi:NAD(P)-dependent dehydrogenase (short-subunit alcohol dehydrogenase family)
MNIQLKGPFFLTQQLLPLINDGGRIINISSGLTASACLRRLRGDERRDGSADPLSGQGAGARQIGVNILAPGAIETDLGGAVRDNAAFNAMVASNTALGRAGQPDDIGGALAMLLAPGAQWINGQRVEASGGCSH